LTKIHLIDVTVDANMRTDFENTGNTEALNLMLAGGTIPDIVGSSRIKDFVNQYGPEGAFLPLNDLIDEHALNIKAYCAGRPDIAASVKAADGQMYDIPHLPDGKYGRAYWIMTDWLNALGLEVPHTFDEYKAVLRAFNTQDPNGNGEADVVPFFTGQWPELIHLVTLWDGRAHGSDTYHDVHVNDCQITHGHVGAGHREGIKNLARWYADGLIDAEVFTRGSSARDFLFCENLGGLTHGWFASTGGYNSLSSQIEGFELKAMAPAARISGKRIEEHRCILVKPDCWAIGHTNEHPVETITDFDFWFAEEGRRLANFGVEGMHYDLVDGKAIFKQAFLDQGPVNRSLYQIGAHLQGRGYLQDYDYEIPRTNEFALEGNALYDEGDDLIPDFLGVSFNAEEQRGYDRYWGSVRDYMLERQQARVLGTDDVEADWVDSTAQLDEFGYQQVLEVR
jgi:putative aldouronate transport system substrate-binding protein